MGLNRTKRIFILTKVEFVSVHDVELERELGIDLDGDEIRLSVLGVHQGFQPDDVVLSAGVGWLGILLCRVLIKPQLVSQSLGVTIWFGAGTIET